MSPIARWSRSTSFGLRVALAAILILALAGVWLPAALVRAAPGPSIGQEEPERPPRPENVGGGEPAEPPVDQQPEPQEPQAPVEPEPVPVAPESAPVEQEAPPPAPTPEPWGPAQLRLYDPLVAPAVPAGSEATYVLEVAHLGAGGPDAKELWAEAPAGWGVRFAPGASGEGLFDNDGDGWPETRPLFASDWTYVAVTITTPAGLTVTSSATIRVTATSFAADQNAFRSWIDLGVTALVPEPTPPPVVVPEPTPTPLASPIDPTTEPSDSPEPSASDEEPVAEESPETSPDEEESPSADASDESDASASGSAEPSDEAAASGDPGESSASGSADASASAEESPDESASASADASASELPSGSSSASASPSASESASASQSPSASASASPSPSASASDSEPTIVSVPDDGAMTLTPGETTTVRHGFTVGGIADDESVTLAVRVAVDPAWSVTVESEKAIDNQATGPGIAELSVGVMGGQAVGFVVRIAVPEDAAGGTTAMLDVSATVVQDMLVAAVSEEVGPDELVRVESAVLSDADLPEPIEAGSSYDLIVEAVESSATLSVAGGAQFGQVNVFGEISSAGLGVTSVADDTGATYTQDEAITITVDGLSGPWSISCQAIGGGITGAGATGFEWRESGGAWRTFPASESDCLTGIGATTVVIDIRYRVNWGDPIGQVETEITFTLQDGGTGVARPLEE